MSPGHMSTPLPVAPVESKVKAAGAWSYLVGLAGMAVLNGVTDANLVAALPDWLEVFLAPMFPTAAAMVAGYVAAHTPRPDLSQQ